MSSKTLISILVLNCLLTLGLLYGLVNTHRQVNSLQAKHDNFIQNLNFARQAFDNVFAKTNQLVAADATLNAYCRDGSHVKKLESYRDQWLDMLDDYDDALKQVGTTILPDTFAHALQLDVINTKWGNAKQDCDYHFDLSQLSALKSTLQQELIRDRQFYDSLAGLHDLESIHNSDTYDADDFTDADNEYSRTDMDY